MRAWASSRPARSRTSRSWAASSSDGGRTCHLRVVHTGTVASMLRTTWDRVAALRLERQHLDRPASRNQLVGVVRDLVAVQAQVMSSAELALHVRIAKLARDDVRDALWKDRTIVKTWAMRGTLHLVASDELPELVAALGTRRGWLRDSWLRYFKVTEQEMLDLQDAIGATLTDVPMTRNALATTLADRLGDPAFAERVTGSWGTFLKPAAGRGMLCFGPDDGRNVTFVNPASWLGRPMPEPDPGAAGAVIRRHLNAFPGSSKSELARWWGGLPPALQARAIKASPDLAEVDVEGTRAFVLARDIDQLERQEPATGIRLLGGFDPYTLSLQKEAEPLVPRARRSLVSREAGWISAVVLDGGRVVGTWTHKATPRGVSFKVAPW